MIVNNPKFEVSAVKPAQYPKNNLPETLYFAAIGRMIASLEKMFSSAKA